MSPSHATFMFSHSIFNQPADFTPIPPQDAVSIAELLQCLRDKPFAETLLIHQVLQQVSCELEHRLLIASVGLTFLCLNSLIAWQIQQCVAAHLWTLIVSQADLPAYLKVFFTCA